MSETKIITTLDEFITWVKELEDGAYLFRGVSKASYKMEASIYRRLRENEKNKDGLLRQTRELINKARLRGHDEKDGRMLFDLELLAKLQHYGAATCLIDFSRSPLMALWIACQQSSGEKEQEDGKVFAIRIDDASHFKTITPELLTEDIEYFFEEEVNIGNKDKLAQTLTQTPTPKSLYQWQPKHQNHRIIAQSSVFIFGDTHIDTEAVCEIDRDSKSGILKALNKLADINDESLYPDFDGFARLHAHDKPGTKLDPQEYLAQGIELHQEGKLDAAIREYSKAINLKSDLVDAYYNRGSAYGKKGEHKLAIQDFNKVIEGNPNDARIYHYRGFAYDHTGDHNLAIQDYNKALEFTPNDAQIYRNRGFAYDHKGDYDLAIQDYNKALELNPNEATGFHNRGLSYSKKDEHDLAIQDFTTAIKLKPEYATAYNNRGNAYRSKGDYGRAIQDYNKAIELNSDLTGTYFNRATTRLILGDWENVKTDLTATQRLGLDITFAFQETSGSIQKFEQKHNITIPADIRKLLDPSGSDS